VPHGYPRCVTSQPYRHNRCRGLRPHDPRLSRHRSKHHPGIVLDITSHDRGRLATNHSDSFPSSTPRSSTNPRFEANTPSSTSTTTADDYDSPDNLYPNTFLTQAGPLHPPQHNQTCYRQQGNTSRSSSPQGGMTTCHPVPAGVWVWYSTETERRLT